MKRTKNDASRFESTFKNRPDFLKELKVSRKLLHPTVKKRDGKIIAWNDKILESETNRLLIIFKFPHSLFEDVKEIIKTGKIKFKISPTKPKINITQAKPNGETALHIEIYKYTTEKEYRSAWKEIKKWQNAIDGYDFKPISKKELRVIKLREKGMNEQEIYNKTGYEFDFIRKTISRKGRQFNLAKK